MQNLPQGITQDTISLMLGHPDPAALLTPAFQVSVGRVMESPDQALQYGAEAGNPALLEYLVGRTRATQQVALSREQMMITAGSTHANDLIARLYARGGSVIVEAPTYADALYIYRDHGIELHSVPIDAQGALINEFEALLERLPSSPRLFYTIPNFHNPSGITTTEARRREILRLAEQYKFAIVEDDVYRELAFGAPVPASYLALAQGTGVEVMQIGSFSKTLAPGLRLGWVAASSETIENFVNCGTSQMGGGANPFTAQIVADYCLSGGWERQIKQISGLYQTRRDCMLAALERYMPAEVKWTTPAGGFFVWVTLEDGKRGQDVKRDAEARGVLVAAGEGYFIDPAQGAHNLRLTYSFAPLAAIETGVKILGEVIERAG